MYARRLPVVAALVVGFQLRMALSALGCSIRMGLAAEEVAGMAAIEAPVAFAHIVAVEAKAARKEEARMLMMLRMGIGRGGRDLEWQEIV